MQRFTSNFLMRVDQAFLDAVDAWRRAHPDIPSRSEAVRTLVYRGLGCPVPPEDGDPKD